MLAIGISSIQARQGAAGAEQQRAHEKAQMTPVHRDPPCDARIRMPRLRHTLGAAAPPARTRRFNNTGRLTP